MSKPSQQARDSPRQRILQTCIRLMQQHGFAAVGMRDIASCLQIKAPSLYHHFASKDDLAAAAMECYRLAQEERLKLLNDLAERSDRLVGYIDLFTEMLADESRLCLCQVMLRERDDVPSETLSNVRKFVRQNVDWLEMTVGDSRTSLSRLTPKALAEAIFSSLEGLMLVATIERSPARYFRSRAIDLLRGLGLL